MRFRIIKGRRIVTILEMDDNWLKFVQAEALRHGHRIIRTLAKDISKMKEDEIIKLISDLGKEFKIDPNNLAISIPAHFASIRNPEFPSTDIKEIGDMVELQIGKQTPYSTSEIVSDYQIAYTSPDGYSRLMLVIVHRDIINRYSKILEKAGFKTERIVLGSDGVLSWSQLAHKDTKYKDTPFLLIDVDYSVSNLMVILADKIIFNRTISQGSSQSIFDIEKWQKEFIEEVKRYIYAYNNEIVNKDIGKIIISGSERLTSRLNDNLLRDDFKLPVEILGQFKNVPATKETLDLYGGNIKDLSISALIGFALRYKLEGINLLPQEIRIERAVKKKARELYIMGTLLAIMLISLSSIFLEKIYNKEHYLSKLEAEVSSLQDKATALERMMERTEIINVREDANGSVLNALYEIYRIISPEIHLLSLSFDGKYSVDLRGTSTDMSEVFKFVDELEKSDYFENVKTKYVSKNRIEGQEVADFEIICPFSSTIQRALREY